MELSQINVPLLAAVSTFIAAALLVIGIFLFVRQSSNRRAMLEKIRSGDSDWLVSESDSRSMTLTGSEIPTGAMARFLRSIGAKTKADKSVEKAEIKLKFLRAGLRDKNSPTIFWGIKILLSVGLMTIFLAVILIFRQSMDPLLVIVAAVGLALIGLFLPDYWLWKKAMNRRNKIIKGFPDALDMLVVCVEAGMGLDAAINRVGLELELGQPELSEEFKMINLELRAGKARASALKSMGERINVEDVDSLITLLLQTDRFGTSVGQALRVFSDTFRTKRYQRAEEAAAKIATKMIFPLVTCIFPAMFTVLLGPAAIVIYRTLIQK